MNQQAVDGGYERFEFVFVTLEYCLENIVIGLSQQSLHSISLCRKL